VRDEVPASNQIRRETGTDEVIVIVRIATVDLSIEFFALPEDDPARIPKRPSDARRKVRMSVAHEFTVLTSIVTVNRLPGPNVMRTALTGALLAAMIMLVSSFDGTLYAYLDPGTGSIVIQAVIAGIVGALAIVRLYWHKLRSIFRRQ
jgi:hypothetical protein